MCTKDSDRAGPSDIILNTRWMALNERGYCPPNKQYIGPYSDGDGDTSWQLSKHSIGEIFGFDLPPARMRCPVGDQEKPVRSRLFRQQCKMVVCGRLV